MTTRRRKTGLFVPPPDSLYTIAQKRHGPDPLDISWPLFRALQEAASFITVDEPGRHQFIQIMWDWVHEEFKRQDDPAAEGLRPNNGPSHPMETRIGPDLQHKKTHAPKHRP